VEIRQEESSLSEYQISIWSVRRSLFASYFVTFSLLFVLLSGIAAWLTYMPVYGVRDAAELVTAAMGLASGRILWLAAFSIIAVEVGNVIVEYLIVDRFRRGQKAERQKWQAWYQRMQAAQREGKAFDEPPPGTEDNGK